MAAARRRFDHLAVELSVAVGHALPRYRLWLALREQGLDAEHLSRAQVLAFCARGLDTFLREQGLHLAERPRRRLERRLARFDARYPTPEERLAALTG